MEKTGGSIFLKILKILATLLLTFIFIITAFVLPLYYSVAGIFTPKTVATVVQNIDYVEIIEYLVPIFVESGTKIRPIKTQKLYRSYCNAFFCAIRRFF